MKLRKKYEEYLKKNKGIKKIIYIICYIYYLSIFPFWMCLFAMILKFIKEDLMDNGLFGSVILGNIFWSIMLLFIFLNIFIKLIKERKKAGQGMDYLDKLGGLKNETKN